MNNKSFRILQTIIIPILAVFIFSCSGDNSNGKLGIEVPIGQGRVSDETPYIIVGVIEGSPAYNAGIRPDDIIIQIDEVPIRRGMVYDDIYNNLLRGKAGSSVMLVVKRDGKSMIFKVMRVR